MTLDDKQQRMIAAMKRAAIQESHEVRAHMFQWIRAFEEGVTPDNGLVTVVPARDEDGEVLGHLVTSYSFGASGEPSGSTDWQPVHERATLAKGGSVQDV